jgi:hypothetical protein
MEDKIPTPLGGYGAREGKPATGTLDTIYGKVILFELGGAEVGADHGGHVQRAALCG